MGFVPAHIFYSVPYFGIGHNDGGEGVAPTPFHHCWDLISAQNGAGLREGQGFATTPFLYFPNYSGPKLHEMNFFPLCSWGLGVYSILQY